MSFHVWQPCNTPLYKCRVREVLPFVVIMVICQNYVITLCQQLSHFKILIVLLLYFRHCGLFKALFPKLCSEPGHSVKDFKKICTNSNRFYFVYISQTSSSRKNCCLMLKVMLDYPFGVLRFCRLTFRHRASSI